MSFLPAAQAACTPAFGAGANVTCTGSIFGINSTANNMIVTVAAGALVQPAVVNPGYVVNLTGNNMTFNNNGTVDPSLVAGLSLVTSGARIGGTNNSFVTVNNTGILKGTSDLTLGQPLASLTGLALDVQNGASGQNTLTNSGTIGATAILGAAIAQADIPVVSVRGGSPTTFTNTATGTITGRIAFQGSTQGNKFINAGFLTGSLHMGMGGNANTFTAVTGSQVSQGDGVGGVLSVTPYPLLTFAATGTVDGGGGTLNNLILQNAASGTGSGTTGTGTISSANYINFSNLTVNSGTWTLSGPVLTGTTSTTLNGGILSFDNALGMGTGQITSNGGTLQAGASNLSISNVVNIAAGGLSIIGGNTLALTSATTGSGVLTKSGIGTLVLSGANTHSGGTTLAGGTIQLGNGAGLGTGALNVTGASTLQSNSTMTVTNDIQLNAGLSVANLSGSIPLTLTGVVSGTSALSKTGAADLILTGNSNFSGGFNLLAGKAILGSAASIGSGVITAAGGTSLDTQVSLTLDNNLVLNGALTLTGSSNLALNGQTSGTGSLVKAGTRTLVLNAANTHSGGVSLGGGGLTLGNNSALGTGALTVTANSSLDVIAASTLANNIVLNNSALTLGGSNALTLGGTISGAASGELIKMGVANLTLTGSNSYTGGTQLQSGRLIIGNNGALGTGTLVASGGTALDSNAARSIINDISLLGNLSIIGSNDLTLSGVVSGSGGLTKNGTSTLVLSGMNTYGGNTILNAGTLLVNGSVAGGVQTSSNTTLGGTGRIGGDVTVVSGATLAPGGNGPGTLTIGGDLTLQAGSASKFELGQTGAVGGASNDLVSVEGNLSLGGALTATAASAGWYRLFNYGGDLSGGFSSTTVNSSQSGFTVGRYQLDTATAGQINLAVVGDGQSLQFWNGSQNSGTGTVTGGSGTWNTTSTNWTDNTGTATQGWQSSVAVFGGSAGGTVTVEGRQAFDTLQFTTDGYSLVAGTAGTLALAPATGTQGIINTNAGISASIAAPIVDGLGTGLRKVGSGTLTLSGTNTYTGGTTVAEGTLVAASDNALGTGGVTVDNSSNHGATLQINSGVTVANTVTLTQGGTLKNAGTLAGNLLFSGSGANHVSLQAGSQIRGNLDLGSNTASVLAVDVGSNTVQRHSDAVTGTTSLAGALVKSGAGTWVLDRNLGATSASIIDGTLQLGDGGTSGSLGSGLLTNNGTLAIKRSNAITVSSQITGTGRVVQDGPGTTTLTGTNNYSGGTTINAGRLVASAASLGSGVITNQAALELNQATDGTLAQAISGSGSLTKTGTGTLALTADSSAFTGSTQINAGALALGSGAVLGGSLAVGSGATLTGSGTVGSTVLASGAAIAPGSASGSSHTYGTLTINGDLTFQPGSTYQVHADPGSNTSDQIVVTGTANLAGGVLHVGPEAGFETARTYTILTANQVSGTFNTVASNYAYLDPKIQYGAADVSLRLQRKANQEGTGSIRFADLAQTGNQVAVANGIESLPSSSALFRFIESLPNGTPPEVFNSLSGESHASIQAGMGVGSRMFGMSTMNRLHSNLTANLRPGAPIAQSDGPLPASAWPSIKALPAWAEVVGQWQTFTGNSEAGRLKQDIGGFFAGADTEVGSSGWRLGGAVGYTRANAKVADRSSKATTDNYSVAVYGGKSFEAGPGRLNVMGGLSYTWHDINSERQVAALAQHLKSDYRGSTTQLFAEVGYALGQYDKVGIEPFAGINLGHQRTRGFQETGGFAALRGDGSSDDLVTSILGVRAHSDFNLGRTEGRLRATLGWRHAFGDVTTQTTMAFEGGQSFTVAGVPLARDTAVGGLEAELDLSRRSTLVLGYKGEFGDGNRDHSAQVRVRWAF